MAAKRQLSGRRNAVSPLSPLSDFLDDIRRMIDETRQGVATAVNAAMTMLYWRVGKRIRDEILKGERAQYGERIVSTLSRQLMIDYGRGFSAKNLRHMLRFADAKSGRSFPDAVGWRSGFLDIGFVRFERMKVHDVPYRSLVPEKMDGLLVAGRCISASHVAASAGKSMGNCMATGHAAGLAAAMSADQNIQPRNLDVQSLRQRLEKDGVDFNRAGDAQENVR